jgi:inorganic pyrophosphatase
MRDDKGLDEKILAVPVKDPLDEEYHGLDDVPGHYLREVEHFFAIYKELEGVRAQIMGWDGQETACRIVNECRERYAREMGKT